MKKIIMKEKDSSCPDVLSRRSEDKPSPQGRILRVKQGYNPNSSSIGSVLFALPSALFGIIVVFGAVSGLIMSAFLKRMRSDVSSKSQNLKHEKTKNRYLEAEDD